VFLNSKNLNRFAVWFFEFKNSLPYRELKTSKVGFKRKSNPTCKWAKTKKNLPVFGKAKDYFN
jgi:hypothetical protein